MKYSLQDFSTVRDAASLDVDREDEDEIVVYLWDAEDLKRAESNGDGTACANIVLTVAETEALIRDLQAALK